MRTIRRVFVTLPVIAFLATSLTSVIGAAAASAAPAQSIDDAGSATLAVRQLTRGAGGGPFHFELSDRATPPSVHSGVATTTADGDAVDVSGLVGTLAPGTYTLRQDLSQLPADPTAGHWDFTGVECDGAAVTLDVSTGSATITLDPEASATCTVTDTWVADEIAATREAAPATGDATAAAVAPADPPPDVITPLASPLAATITVHKSGIRTGPTSEGPLAGATFATYGSQADAVNRVNPITTCVTNALGQCSMDVAASGGRNVWVREVTQPAGYFRIDTISTGTSSQTSDNTTSAPYLVQLTVQNNQTYQVPPPQALESGGSEARAFANGLNNPSLSPACGLNVGMVFDVSSSINATEMTSMKNAARTFVNTLTGTPSQIGMFSFGTEAPAQGAPANLPLTSVASGNAPLQTYINNLPANPSSGTARTNWDAGLFQVAQSTSSFDVVLMLTDGNPTVWAPDGRRATGSASIGQVVPSTIEEAVASANAVKQKGSHIISIGIGSNLPVDNLTAISGPGDAFVTNFDQLAAFLEQLATAACQGTVTIVKEAQPRGASGFTPAGGWTFNTVSAAVTPTSGTTAAGTGATNFKVDFSTSSLPKTISFDEVLQPGWNLVQQGGLNAKCTTQALTSTRSSSNAGPTGFNVTVGPNDIVSCLVRNQQQSLPTLTLRKVVVNNNGGTAQPTAWTLNADGPTALSGTTGAAAVTNVVVPAGTYNLSESNGPPGYTASAWSCTGAASSTATSVTLSSTSTATCTITNDDQPAHLTLVKTVTNNFGSALPTDWTLNATGPTNISGVTGSAAVTNAPVNAGNYTVFESNGPPGYVSSAWDCTTSLRSAFRTSQTLTLTVGESATCTLNNVDASAQLTLVKQVINNNGGTAVATAWTLGADGPEILSGATGSPAVTAVQVPTGTYGLSETGGPPGYAASPWSCTGATQFTGTSVTLDIGQSATCTITNDDIAAHLTLSKAVINDNGGTAAATDWTLNAAGPTTGISGATGTAPVTNVAVLPGTYALSEGGPGPPGYAASPWACTGAAVSDGTSVTPALGENVFCAIVNEDQPALLTLVKQVTNDSGGTALATDWTLSAQGASSGISGSTGSASVTNVGVPPGTYALSETGPSGYLASAWSCVGGTQTGASIAVALGESATCTITNNDIAPQLTLQKTVINDNGGTAVDTDWTLTATGPTPGVSGVEGDAAITNAPVLAGLYTLTEAGPAGYTPSGWVCAGAAISDATSVTLGPGEVATCTITNDDIAAELTLVKTVTNDNGGTAAATDWTLNATGPTPISGATGSAAVTAAPVSAGTYALTEAGPSGYAASAWSCVGGTQTGASIALTLGQSATCTINNNDIAAQLTLVKTVTNDNGGTALPTAWTLTATGPTPISGATGSPAVTAAPVSAGTYALTELGPTGYGASAWSCVGGTQTGSSIALAVGQSATCTISNDDIPAQLTLVKTVTNDNGGTALPTDWTLTATGPTTISGVTGSPAVTAAAVSAGTYALTETGPAGYGASAWSCVGGTQTGASIALALGQSATCTINNDDAAAQLTLVKTVTNDNGGTAAATDWTLSAAGPTPISGATGSPAVTGAAVNAGTYALSESGPAGYTASAWACTGGTQTGASIALAVGQSATCTITNDDQPAQLTLVKTVTNDNGGGAAATDWTLSADGPTPISGATGNAAVTQAPVSAGSYALTETGPTGYGASAWTCTGGTQTGSSIALAVGQSATCTITNNDIAAQLTLVKTVTNDNGGTAAATEWTLTAAGPTPISGATGSGAVTAAPVSAGTYALTEAGPTGYSASAWSCVGGTQTGASIALALGDSATCTITNDDIPARLTLVKEVVNDDGGIAVPTDWTLTADGPTPISGVTGDPSVTDAPVSAGTYFLSESDVPGYVPTALVCTGGILDPNPAAPSITVALGESATCTITNDDLQAEITLVKSSSATAITPGSTVPYSYTVTNVSATPAQNVVVTDPLPAGLTFVSSPDGCTANAAQMVTCTIANLAPGDHVTFNTVTMAANPFPAESVDPDGMVPNTAKVTAPDTNCPPLGRAVPTTPGAVGALQATADDCESTDPLPLLPTLTISKTSAATEIVPGGQVPYTITVTNTGPVVASDVVVTDTLPAGLSYVSSVPACTASGQVVTCPLGDLAAGASATIDLVTLAQNPFPVVNGPVINVAVVVGGNSNCGEGSGDPVCRADWPLPIATVAGESVEPTNGNGNGGDGLPFTGSSNLPTFVAGACLFVGLTLLGVARRRRRPHAV